MAKTSYTGKSAKASESTDSPKTMTYTFDFAPAKPTTSTGSRDIATVYTQQSLDTGASRTQYGRATTQTGNPKNYVEAQQKTTKDGERYILTKQIVDRSNEGCMCGREQEDRHLHQNELEAIVQSPTPVVQASMDISELMRQAPYRRAA